MCSEENLENVLKYIRNETKRFHVFVANRVHGIRDETDPIQWRHVDSENNPADDASIWKAIR